MASTEQPNGFRLPWSGPPGTRPEATGGSGAAAVPGTDAPAAPNRFQPILLRAMRAAAEENRNAMLAACREEAEASITGLHGRSAAESGRLRHAAGGEITFISDYAKAEIARITAEADEAIAARRAQLSKGLEEQTARVELEIGTVRARVAAFEADLGDFFGRLDAVADPAGFAALTSQLPEPPRLRDADDDLAAYMPGGPLHQAAAEAATAGASPAPADPGPTPSAEAMPTPVADAPPTPDAATTIEVTPVPREPGEPMVTTVVVVGLVNIASIAAFKRHVSGLRGVQSVAVSSGPGGEFVFKVAHEPGVALGDEVTLLPGFGARIVDSREGVLQVSARDPGAAA